MWRDSHTIILKCAVPLEDDPSRKTLGGLNTFVKQTLNMAAQYMDWVTPGNVKGDVLVPPGSGAVVRRGLKKIAVYCDDAGEL